MKHSSISFNPVAQLSEKQQHALEVPKKTNVRKIPSFNRKKNPIESNDTKPTIQFGNALYNLSA